MSFLSARQNAPAIHSDAYPCGRNTSPRVDRGANPRLGGAARARASRRTRSAAAFVESTPVLPACSGASDDCPARSLVIQTWESDFEPASTFYKRAATTSAAARSASRSATTAVASGAAGAQARASELAEDTLMRRPAIETLAHRARSRTRLRRRTSRSDVRPRPTARAQTPDGASAIVT